MEVLLKIGSLASLFAIAYQDFKERKIAVYLLLLLLGCLASLYSLQTAAAEFLFNLGLNITIIMVVLGILLAYALFRLKKPLFEVFGLGDALFFLVLACSFTTPVFVTLFAGSLIFALLLFLILKPSSKETTVPLAGLQALFIALILLINWSFNLVNLYISL